MRSRPHALLLAALLGTTALLTGCSGDAAEGTTDGADGPVFDQPYTFESGWVITISSPAPVDGEADTYVVEVAVENGTDAEHNPSSDFVEVHADGGVADGFFDAEAGIGGPPDESLAPGDQAQFGVGFIAEDVESVTVVVSSTAGLNSGGASEEATFGSTHD